MRQTEQMVESISKKLDLVLGLLIQMRPRARSEREDILALKSAGLTVEEIARVLGKTPNSVRLVLSRSRRKVPQ